MVKLSVILISKNEHANIKDCLDSVYQWADEIVVIDDESTDDTRDMARQYTDRIFIRKMDLEGKQRNYGASMAKNDWVMMIDADERMTPELKTEIESVLANRENPKLIAFWIPRKNYIADHWLQHGGWYPAPHIKLYHRDHLKWREIPQDVVHPGVDIEKGFQKANLTKHLIHYNFKNIEDFMGKVNRQTTLEAIKWHIEGKKVSMPHAFWKTFDRFARRYLRKKGYRDGYYGFVAAVLSGFYQFAAYSKLREIQRNGMYLDRIQKQE